MDLWFADQRLFELPLPPRDPEPVAPIARAPGQPMALHDPPTAVGSLHEALAESSCHGGYPTSALGKDPGVYRRLGWIAMLVAAVVASPTAALAQDTGPAIAALTQDGLYVEAGAETVEDAVMRSAIDTAADQGVDLRIAVFASGAAEPLAAELAEALGSVTILAFTPSSFGVFSNELSQERLDGALADARDELSGPDAAAGARAFAEALTLEDDSGGVSAGLIVAGIVGLLIIVAIAGRLWEVRTRDARRAKRRLRRQEELREQTKEVGGRILDLSDAVELSENAGLAAKYATATSLFDSAEAAIAAAPGMHELDDVAEQLEKAEALLDEVAAGVGP